MKLSATIKSHGWRRNADIVNALKDELPHLAEWVKSHPSVDTVLGLMPGISLYFNEHDVTDEDMLQVVACMHDQPWFFEPITKMLGQLHPFEVPVAEEIHYKDFAQKIEETFADRLTNKPRMMDRYFYTMTPEALEEAVKNTGYEYGRWIAEEMDCDEWAGRLWGALQRTVPGNLAIGFTTICGWDEEGKGQCHALLLALTTKGCYWVENTGKLHPLGELPGWQNDRIHLDIGIF